MLDRQRHGAGRSSVRELPLLETERIVERFVPNSGLVAETPHKGELLVLTNQRVISFIENGGHKQMYLAPVGELNGVSVKANSRGLRDLFQGVGLIFVGILSYLIIGYILDGVTIALALGVAIVFVGMLFLVKFLFWEEEGNIAFQGSSWELSFPYKSNAASADIYRLVDRFFQIKMQTNSYYPPLEEDPGPHLPETGFRFFEDEPGSSASGPPPSPYQGETTYDG